MNQALFDVIFSLAHRSPTLDAVIFFLAEILPYVLAAAFLVLLFISVRDLRGRFAAFGTALAAVLLGRGVFTELIRLAYAHPRPFVALSIEPIFKTQSGLLNSFPSGHAAIFFALATMALFLRPKWALWFFVLAGVNGFARVAAGVHWPFDIAGGAGVGILSGIVVYRLIEPYLKKIDALHTMG